MATIERRRRKSGAVHYRVKIRLGGLPPETATFATLAAARRWAALREGALRAQRPGPPPSAHAATVDTLLERYAREVLPHKSRSTERNQTLHCAWWREQLGTTPLAAVTPALLAQCRDLLAQERAPATVNGYLATLSHALTLAVSEWQWLEESPLRRVRRLREPRGRVRYLSDDERQRLLEACAGSPNRCLLPLVVLALSTGARKHELLSLTWTDVDLRRGQLTLEHTKNRQRRALPLTGLALEQVQQLARVRRLDTALLFPRADGLQPLDIRHAWAQALTQAAIADFRFHDLRHSAASYLAMSGASLADIAAILGHKTLHMVQRYAHLSDAHTAAVVARMNAAIFPTRA